MKIKKIFFILSVIILPVFIFADVYEGEYKYYRKITHIFKDNIPAEVAYINFGYIGSYVNNDYIIRFKEDGGSIKQNIIKKIKILKQKIEINKRSLEELKYNKYFTNSEKNEEKRVYIESNNIWNEKIKDYKNALILLENKKNRYGIKFTGFVQDIEVDRGDILEKGFPIFTSMDDKTARMVIKISDYDFNNINKLKVRRNNTVIERNRIKYIKDKKTGENLLYLFIRNPSPYEVGKKYKITIY